MKKSILFLGPLTLTLAIAICSLSAFAWEEHDDYNAEAYHPVTSMEAFTQLGEQTAGSLSLAADYAKATQNIDYAIKLSRLALKRDNDDLDIHKTYAECLEKKLSTQSDKDPGLYNQCVKEWLFVYRNEFGDEKGLTWHGVGVPAMQKYYEDDDHVIPARAHLLSLTGTLPKPSETNAKFLKRVSKPANTDVFGKVLSNNHKTKNQGNKELSSAVDTH